MPPHPLQAPPGRVALLFCFANIYLIVCYSFYQKYLIWRTLNEIQKKFVSQFSVISFATVGLCQQYIKIKANKLYGCKTLNLSGCYIYSRVKHFWLLKCLNWNLGASQLQGLCWKGCLGRVGRGWDGASSIALSSSSHHLVFCIMGSATKVSGQIRLRLLYRLF
jgi:hypothetical protein